MREIKPYEEKKRRDLVEYTIYDNLVALPINKSIYMRLYFIIRSLCQLIIALFSLPVFILLVPLILLANRLTAPGDLLYRQERIGQGGRRFQILKFRTMVMDAEKYTGAVWTKEEDPRITPIGYFLRPTHLDELPQIWNVLKGEMNIIGPRPERPYFVNKLCEQIPLYDVRHTVKPGITGWAQVNYGYGASIEDACIKLEYDLFYIKHQGLYLDFLTLLKTVFVILGLQGR